MNSENLELATLAGGCFWCTEAVFQRLKGVEEVLSGFTGGNIKNPAYREIITGRTGHAEAIQIRFNPTIISFQELLYVFLATHDPTTLNRQQNDVGTQYRSAVFYHSEKQKEIAEEVIQELENKEIFQNKIVTEISAVKDFYIAEKEHQDFYNQHRQQPYCQFIIDPKIKKLTEVFADKLK
ncbi:peptide-methionine (S)-S-oxide reductase MsrA [Salegentibacter mishustinae]|uniref:Peptide methionine sulfoxide reductase MsrA n=1 Tax=Salegentibacter mishustinae TaxID=270918 RepID=A0A0Q9ZAS4_9FLAO|nr:peptide-methionine (S)-S-oxide reductase MsrA [Salegentibacter mishustinae]KRG27138.1 methionine sulfoxide reductase A [Salegentibacter mishustinae]PNW21371.1 methionine sulfoxide reductase A [Salegentibacter mishustinae]PZX62690.1 peptide-methionine (S)-S-oxide reductase [Salegentibacter mishustinae]GGW97582.1 peptide methionine sulfoxide reductase MsrA [Salegentibacter mishustinae]